MANITITINTDNAAFCDYPGAEVARILHKLGDSIIHELTDTNIEEPQRFVLRDFNGNTVGECKTSPSV